MLFVEFWKSDSTFRKKYLLFFYSVLVMFRTLLNRNLWLNPLSKIMDNLYWFEYNSNKGLMDFNPEPVENIFMFIPLIIIIYYIIMRLYSKKSEGDA